MEEAMSSTEQSAQNELVGGLAISQLVGEEDHDHLGGAEETGLKRRLWVETKKLWHLVGPTILSRICSATFAVVTQAFAGHLGDVELPSPSSTPLFLASVSDSCLLVSFLPGCVFPSLAFRSATSLKKLVFLAFQFKSYSLRELPVQVQHECECLGNDDSYFFLRSNRGIWGGMIFGTAAQTIILAVITILCDWEKEAQKAVLRVKHLSSPNPDDDHLMVEN
ncbi:hypothetical protein RHGRI_016608 [Rhododendron griersonianum]|uniref:Uncharacterized protein n=1 Tax=Rhododendron griersonianum TaxID=479676 RepID=A0AAV6JUS2_9ERIC|nr:hypothetical protein RHGRI_016608 [Rhododendron griersonianum]